MEIKQTLVYDIELKAPACALIQAIYGCGSSPKALDNFESRHFITKLTPGMRKITFTAEEWKAASALMAQQLPNVE